MYLAAGPDLGGAGVSHQTPQFLKPCNSIANPFLKFQIRHWAQASNQGPQASHQLNPALFGRTLVWPNATLPHCVRTVRWVPGP